MSTSPLLPVAIVGGGPVGLTLAHGLLARGVDCRVLEREERPRGHSRSIGIHPVSLELFAKLGLAQTLVEAGLKIQRGHAFVCLGERIGSLDFDRLPPPFPFILSIPQYRTEALLESALLAADADAVSRGADVYDLEQRGDHVRVHYRQRSQRLTLDAELVVGCDGIRSTVRHCAGIRYAGGHYPDRFAMGDFVDDTELGAEAAIFLHPAGLIESFPLPEGLRRWVVHTGSRGETRRARAFDERKPEGELRNSEIRDRVVATVRERLGHDLAGTRCLMTSCFGVQHFLARRFALGRLILAGDAAHVVSPIGGQGMNLGFKDVERLLASFDQMAQGVPRQRALERYGQRSQRVARAATRRSAFYMQLGRARRFPLPRDRALRLLLAMPPLADLAARMFTMRGLETVPF